MPILLFRIDDRLIHGQVVIGWGSQLRPDRYIVVDDLLADNDWERQLYLLGVPEGSEALFVSVDEARSRLSTWRESPRRSLLLTKDIESMLRLARGGVLGEEEVNLGGIHFAPGRVRILSYLYLDDAERELLRDLARETKVSAKDLPSSMRTGLSSLLR